MILVVAPLMATAVVALLVGASTIRRSVPGARALAVLLFALSWWSIGYALEIAAGDLAVKLFWARVQYLGIVIVPLAWRAFALGYTGQRSLVPAPIVGLFYAEPFITLALVWTNDLHGLMWPDARLVSAGSAVFLELDHGPAFWFHSAIAYLLLLGGTYLLVNVLLRYPTVFRRQSVPLLVGVLSPWIGNFIYLSGLSPFAYLDLTPFAAVISGVAFAVAVYRYRLLELSPIARDDRIFGLADSAILLDHKANILDLNRAAEQVLGIKAATVAGHPLASLGGVWALITPGDPVEPVERTLPIIVADSPRFLNIRTSPVFHRSGNLIGWLLLAVDVTEQRRQVAELEASEERYRTLVENAPDIIYSHDLHGRFMSVNAAAETIAGYTREEALALNFTSIVAPEYLDLARSMIARKLAGEGLTVYELDLIAKGGERVSLEVSSWLQRRDGEPVGIQGIARDITERKRLQAQLQQAQKMEAIGQLAGGVAHDFNNLLTAINGFSQLAIERLGDDHPVASYIRTISRAGDQAAALTGQLLAFGRRQVVQARELNLNLNVRDIESMLRRLIGENIELVTRLADDLDFTLADDSQIQQIILNLAINARDAMPSGGLITIETRNAVLDEVYCRQYVEVQPGPYVLLAVSDTGTGMSPETIRHIYEPFFTTKEKGKGTGLGLSTVYGIVSQSAGHIDVTSELGTGTTFAVYLPRASRPAPLAVAEPTPPDLAIRPATILVVEDESIVRSLIRVVLEANGFRILESAHPNEALAIVDQEPGPIDLLITDVVMPHMNGRELAILIEQRRLGIKVLYMSGYADDAIVHHGVLAPGFEFIAKPFSPDAIVRKVREMLEPVPA